MRSYSSREILQILMADGWIIRDQAGSHVQLVHPTKPGKVTVPHLRKDLPIRTVRSIFKQAGMSQNVM